MTRPTIASESAITAAVVSAMEDADDPRVRQISQALVRHLHAFIREIEPNEREWEAAIGFLTATGQKCSATRQEFILLSDTLGASMLVDAVNHRTAGAATETTVFGPFYVEPTSFAHGADISGHLTGTPMYIGGVIRDEQGGPIVGAIVDIWHSDEDGFYDLQKLDVQPDFSGRGRFFTDGRGAFHLWTVRPSPYPIPDDGPVGQMLAAQGRHPYRPEHVHFMIQAPGRRKLVTHLFAAGGDYLDSDVVFGVKPSLIRDFVELSGGTAPDGRPMEGAWVCLEHEFVLAPEVGAQTNGDG